MPWRRHLRLLCRWAGYALAASLVLLALGNGIGSQLLPLVERHPDRIAAWLSVRAGRPVAFDRVTTEWTRRGPLLRLGNLRVGDPAQPLRIGDVELLLAQYTGLLPGHSFTELRLRGVDLTLQRAADGQWQVLGLPGQQSGGNPLDVLANLGELQLTRAQLHVLAPTLGIDLRLPRIDLRLRVDDARIRAGARAWLHVDGEPFDIAADLQRSSGDARVYAGTRQADLAALAGTFDLGGITPVAGRGRLRAWAQLHGYRVTAVHADAGLQDVQLRGRPVSGQRAPVQRLGTLELDARWRGRPDAWHVQVPRLRLGDGARQQTLDGLALAGGAQGAALRAPRLDVAPLLQVVALGDVLPERLRRWAGATLPDARLQNVEVSFLRGGRWRARARISDVHFDPAGSAPGLRGVAGWLQADQDGARLRFDPGARMTFDWPAGFGVAHVFALDGEAVLWRDGDGWTVRTPGLSIQGDVLRLHARGGIGFANDGTRPRLDIAADIGDVPLMAARGFWIHHLMPKATIQWLDMALQGGTLRAVHAVVAGDLDDWPFRSEPGLAGAGVFRADAHVEDGTLKFQHDWPAAQHLNADVSFVADGFTVTAGQAVLAGVPVSALKAGIARFGRAELTVDAVAAGDAGRFLSMLQASPLHREHGEVMDNLRAAGPAQARLQMLLPLHHQQPPPSRIEGTVALGGVRLAEQRWALVFEQMRGQVRFDRDGFDASNLQVRHEGAPGLLTLRAGAHVRDPAQAFEATLQAPADIDALLDKAGNLGWLKPYLRGSASWTTELTVPRGMAQAMPPSRLRLRSNLVGTAIELPAPLRKPAAQPLPADIQIRLPLDRGDVELTLGNLLSLRSRSSGGRTGLRVQLGGDEAPAPPAWGLQVGGRAGQLDALDWIGVVGGEREGTTLPLRRIEVDTDRLRLLGADLGAARLVVAPVPRGTAVQIQGAAIEGNVLVPSQQGAAVVGHFDRLHWALPAHEAAAAVSAAPATPGSSVDPAAIPPLLLDVADLRIGSAAMGRARFRATPVAGGLRMDEFTTAGSKQRLSATGSWLGRGSGARSQFKLDVTSDDVGALLAGLGYGGQVAGGKGKLGVEAGWRGSPAEFDPLVVDARLSADVRDGQLLEVEPGAGRVLGLLGVAQLRRRLALDFSDFFSKGFAFDRIHGVAVLSQGQLHTDDLAVGGPAAEIHVRGTTDLRDQRFDQTVEVRPKSGSLLTAVGALTGGPVGAAMGAVANAVLDKPMRGIGAKTYRVTGPWDAPQVDVTPRLATAGPKPAGVEGD